MGERSGHGWGSVTGARELIVPLVLELAFSENSVVSVRQAAPV